jgi:hypothetical protein
MLILKTIKGSPFYPPLVILVHIYDASGCEVSGEDELSGLFAQATLYRESGSPPSLAPPDMYLLSGRLSASLELLNEPGAPPVGSSWSQQKGSYVMFPDLTINRPGKYRLGVSLFKVGARGRLRSPISATNGGIGGGTTLEEVKTNVIVVQEDAEAVQIGNTALRDKAIPADLPPNRTRSARAAESPGRSRRKHPICTSMLTVTLRYRIKLPLDRLFLVGRNVGGGTFYFWGGQRWTYCEVGLLSATFFMGFFYHYLAPF